MSNVVSTRENINTNERLSSRSIGAVNYEPRDQGTRTSGGYYGLV